VHVTTVHRHPFAGEQASHGDEYLFERRER
jgi:hypothetical protein